VERRALLSCLFDVLSSTGATGGSTTRATERPRASSRPRVLLAEDNPVNREIATEMLEQIGLDVDVACDGREALDVLARGSYAAVLMDCQMPEIDGYEATRRIRRGEEQSGRPRLPVVAVTAHAMAGERERALAAGMDDYLTKPFTRDQLARIVARWLEPGGVERLAAAAAAEAAPPPPAHVLDPAVRRSAAVLRICLEQLPRSVESIAAAAAAGDQVRIKAEAHKLKGSTLSIGAATMADLCKRIEATPERTGDMLAELRAALGDVRDALERERKGAASAATKGENVHG
jgi:CheY-like chemotaxis protein